MYNQVCDHLRLTWVCMYSPVYGRSTQSHDRPMNSAQSGCKDVKFIVHPFSFLSCTQRYKAAKYTWETGIKNTEWGLRGPGFSAAWDQKNNALQNKKKNVLTKKYLSLTTCTVQQNFNKTVPGKLLFEPCTEPNNMGYCYRYASLWTYVKTLKAANHAVLEFCDTTRSEVWSAEVCYLSCDRE